MILIPSVCSLFLFFFSIAQRSRNKFAFSFSTLYSLLPLFYSFFGSPFFIFREPVESDRSVLPSSFLPLFPLFFLWFFMSFYSYCLFLFASLFVLPSLPTRVCHRLPPLSALPHFSISLLRIPCSFALFFSSPFSNFAFLSFLSSLRSFLLLPLPPSSRCLLQCSHLIVLASHISQNNGQTL